MRYFFRIQRRNGRTKSGVVSAQDEFDARNKVASEDGVTLLTLTVLPFTHLSLNMLRPAESISGVVKQLSLMVGAALPLKESLLLIVKQQRSPRLRRVLEDVYRQICQGVPLSKSMAQHPRYFEPLCCAIIEAGEWSGDLATALRRYEGYIEERMKLRSAVRQALSYPLILLCVSCIVIGVLLTVAVPQIVSQLSVSGTALPWSTRWVLGIGEFLQHYASGLLLFALVMLCAGKRLSRKPSATRRCHFFLLHLPVVGGIMLGIQQVRLLMTMSILSVTSVPVADALRLTCAAVSNAWFREKTTRAVLALTEGMGFTAALEKEQLLPVDQLVLLQAGEHGGRLSEVLSYLARTKREELQQRLVGMVKLLEPLLIFILGLVVLLVFMAIIQPMLTMNSLVL